MLGSATISQESPYQAYDLTLSIKMDLSSIPRAIQRLHNLLSGRLEFSDYQEQEIRFQQQVAMSNDESHSFFHTKRGDPFVAQIQSHIACSNIW